MRRPPTPGSSYLLGELRPGDTGCHGRRDPVRSLPGAADGRAARPGGIPYDRSRPYVLTFPETDIRDLVLQVPRSPSVSPDARRGRTDVASEPMVRPLTERGFQVPIRCTRGALGSGGVFDPPRHEREDGLDTRNRGDPATLVRPDVPACTTAVLDKDVGVIGEASARDLADLSAILPPALPRMRETARRSGTAIVD
ncbi:hypothetical protein [Streptomyces sp. NPDC101455]|uniref:hypothetical protein n=1 Tax=Streptomyces sp. NPDC101455 TaxID=3366142 RepID=UPI00380F9B38